MKFVADLHLHSKYSRAVSQDMVLSKMAEWAKMKGINVLATGDFTHPFWFEQLKNELEETSTGLFRLKTNDKRLMQKNQASDVSQSALDKEVYFLLSCEISSIYSQGGKGRRIHTLVFFPSLKSVEKFNSTLIKKGANLRSDGRPIVGMPARDLAQIAFEADEKALVIPAHVWTPWFSLFGSMSGFDSVEECFGDMAKYIYGIETGLSSDPAMNWRVEDLDSRAILSFSDAHSLEKMGREATVFEAEEMSYGSIYDAIRLLGNWDAGVLGKKESSNPETKKPSNRSKIAFTIEFHPEEGKYHYTGHRDCNFSQNVAQTKKNGDICPVCKRKLTVGVEHRVEDLATRNTKHETRNINGVNWNFADGMTRSPFVSLVPLAEIIAEVEGSAIKTKKVFDQYSALVNGIGSEFSVLLKASPDELRQYASAKVVEGIEKVRRGDIKIDPGYDGKFGEVQIWEDGQSADKEESKANEESQLNLFAG